MFDYNPLFDKIEQSCLRPWLKTLPSQIDDFMSHIRHGDFEKWTTTLNSLPNIPNIEINLKSDSIKLSSNTIFSATEQTQLEQQLRQFEPWRKGPFDLFGLPIDTEWRSDWKWNRLQQAIQPLTDKKILDVGCGNGYHCWRMAAQNPELIIGVDPTLIYWMQFLALQHFIQSSIVHYLPFVLELLPENLQGFDTVFSMGVLYHRKSPIDHLVRLRECLKKGGELVLETLVIDGDQGQVLVPEGRYAKMRNVWFIPTCETLMGWMRRCHYQDIQLIDVNQTSIAEQRQTDWMKFESLAHFLDPKDKNKTIEGYPAPKRAIFIARK